MNKQVIMALMLCGTAAAAEAASPLKAEAGIGWEYGVIGSQLAWQTPFKPLEVFVTAGADGRSNSGSTFRGGTGASLYPSKFFALSVYGGMSSRYERSIDEYERDFGGSTGIKVYFSGRNKPGFVLGASYIYDGEEWFPLASLGYRF